MLTNKNKKFIKSLQINKYRHLEQCFLVEGAKNVLELIGADWDIKVLLYSYDFYLNHKDKLIQRNNIPLVEQVNEDVLSSLGSLKTNNQALAVVPFKDPYSFKWKKGEWAIALENIQDPGNLGTIIRIADWYNIPTIVCSRQSVDFYHPKVIGSSMGSFLRVNVVYQELENLVSEEGLPVYGLTLNGANLHEYTLQGGGLLLFGNESQGLSTQLLDQVTQRLTIPKWGNAESLNVAISVAVVADNLSRRLKE